MRARKPRQVVDATPARPGRSVTQRDIALRCGISQVGVSLALRGDASISKETIATVRAVAAELGYNPALNDSARRLIARRHGTRVISKVAALFLPSRFAAATYFHHLFQGVQEGMADQGFALLVVSPDTRHEEIDWSALPEVFARGDVDGVIDIGFGLEVKRRRLQAIPNFAGRPVVSYLWPAPECGAICVDDEGGVYAATRHLLDQGHRHLLQYLSFLPHDLEQPRIAGAQRALREFGLDPATHLRHTRLFGPWLAPSIPNDQQAEVSCEEIGFRDWLLGDLTAHPETTAILAWNDGVAQRLWYILTQAGWRVPEDISLIGFDDTAPMLDAQGRNLLTSVRLPLYQVGYQAAQMLIAQILQPATPIHTHILPVELIIRGSTMPPRPR